MTITRRGFLQTLVALVGGAIATGISLPPKPLDKIKITESDIYGLYANTTNITMDAESYKHTSHHVFWEPNFVTLAIGDWIMADGSMMIYTEYGWVNVKSEMRNDYRA